MTISARSLGVLAFLPVRDIVGALNQGRESRIQEFLVARTKRRKAGGRVNRRSGHANAGWGANGGKAARSVSNKNVSDAVRCGLVQGRK